MKQDQGHVCQCSNVGGVCVCSCSSSSACRPVEELDNSSPGGAAESSFKVIKAALKRCKVRVRT